MFCDQFSIFPVLSLPPVFHFLFLPLFCTEISFSKLLNRFTNQTSQSDSVLGRLFPVENIGCTRKQGSKNMVRRFLISLHWLFFSLSTKCQNFQNVLSLSLFYRIANTLFLRDEKYEWLDGDSNMSLFNERRNLLRPCFHSSISFTRIVEKLNKFKFPFKLHDIITSIVFSIIFSVTIIFLLFQYLDLLLIVRTKNKKKREIIILRLFQSIRRIHRNIIARVFLFIFIFSLFFNN